MLSPGCARAAPRQPIRRRRVDRSKGKCILNIDTAIAVNRFGLGARPGDLEHADADPKRWLLQQLAGPSRRPGELAGLPDASSVFVEVQTLRRQRRARRLESADDSAADFVEDFGRVVRRHYLQQARARYRHAATTALPFYERLVHFWSNHFAVSADKPPLPALAGLFENEAIRPNVAGNFSDLLLAAEKHPAMIVYLDNQRSVGAGSTLGKRANRRRGRQRIGLNENLAREILELHTMGVAGGYSQDDVTAFASVLTGWSVGGANERGRFAEGDPGRFEFRDNVHEPGAQQILGRTYSQPGVEQGEAVLRDLALHPSTAQFVATKLARHFVADDPPTSLVERLRDAYLRSDAELTVVYRELIEAGEPWRHPLAKYKTPHDFVVSTLRAFDQVPDDGRFIVAALDLMGQAPFRPGSPQGWPDTADQWGGADALYKRVEWSSGVARFVGSRKDPTALADAVLGPVLTPVTRQAVARAESIEQGTTLFLASPDFQRR